MSGYERECACCRSSLCDQDDWCLNEEDEPVCECCVLCILGEGLLYLPDVEPTQAERNEAAATASARAWNEEEDAKMESAG